MTGFCYQTAQTSTATAGLLIGTVSYLPPELVLTGKADARSDVYSTGVVLFELLTDPVSVQEVATARDTYRDRQVGFASALRASGLDAEPGDGINTWLPVADERSAIVELTAAGIRVAPGGPFQLGDGEGGHVRVTVGVAGDDLDLVAHTLALAARA